MAQLLNDSMGLNFVAHVPAGYIGRHEWSVCIGLEELKSEIEVQVQNGSLLNILRLISIKSNLKKKLHTY